MDNLLIYELLEKRSLTEKQAIDIAESQKDLGAKSKSSLQIVLSKNYHIDQRYSYYNGLDNFTKFLVCLILNEEDLEDAVTTINYVCSEYQRAAEAIEKTILP